MPNRAVMYMNWYDSKSRLDICFCHKTTCPLLFDDGYGIVDRRIANSSSSCNKVLILVHHATAKGENCFPCLVFYFFYCIDSLFCYFTKPITSSLWRKNLEYDEETNAGLCWRFSVKWINKKGNEDEEEPGFGHVHKTGSAVHWQTKISIFFGKNILGWHAKPLSTYVILWGWTCKSSTQGLDPLSAWKKELVLHCGDCQQVTATEVVGCNLASESRHRRVFVASSSKPCLIWKIAL